MAGGEEGGKVFYETPTYATATLVFVFVGVSMAAERGLHHLGKWLRKIKRKPLSNALEVIKDELMLLGFISLLLTVFQAQTAKICVPIVTNSPMLPCPYKPTSEKVSESGSTEYSPYPPQAEDSPYSPPAKEESTGHRRLLGLPSLAQLQVAAFSRPDPYQLMRRMLASGSNSCSKGMEPFVSAEVNHQLHIFIFLLAMVHVVYSCITMLLAIYKVHRWKAWEKEAHALMDKCMEMSTDERIRLMKLKKTSTFVERHTHGIEPVAIRGRLFRLFGAEVKPWEHETQFYRTLTCFFRQFWDSVARADYLTLRMAFVTNHNAGLKFDFHAYLIRSMEHDFSHVVGTSASLWAWVVILLLLNVQGWNIRFWTSFIPFILALVVGTKLEYIMATLAYENAGKPAMCVGYNIKARDALFWFSRPRILLYIMHFIIFQNSFELAIYFWYLWEFGANSCLMKDPAMVYVPIGITLVVQVLCSYITLPLYCLVTQMGSHFQKTIFSEHMHGKLTAWARRHKTTTGGVPDNIAEIADAVKTTVQKSHEVVKSGVIKKTSKLKEVVKAALAADHPQSGSSQGSGAPLHRDSQSVGVGVGVVVGLGTAAAAVPLADEAVFGNRDQNGHHLGSESIGEERDAELLASAEKGGSGEDENEYPDTDTDSTDSD